MLIKRLSEARGISGQEAEVRSLIADEVRPFVDEMRVDNMGNLIVLKRGKNVPECERERPYKVMLSCHMDEVGLMVTSVDRNGLLKFATVGGIDPRVLPSKRVLVGGSKIRGIIGSKPIHLQEPEERTHPFTIRGMYIDVGASSQEEAEKMVKIGDMATFYTEFEEIGSNCVKGKAFDDRMGCCTIIEVLKKDIEHNFDLCCVFGVQEEVGLRGAGPATYSIRPDVALVMECTAAHDLPDVDGPDCSTALGMGPVISHMDRTIMVRADMFNRLTQTADKLNIPWQHKYAVAGGTDAGKINQSVGGVVTGVVSIPCRFIHSPVSVVNMSDYNNSVSLLEGFLYSIDEGRLTQ